MQDRTEHKSDQQYYRPRTDARQVEKSEEKAGFLIDRGYVNITQDYSREDLIEELLQIVSSV